MTTNTNDLCEGTHLPSEDSAPTERYDYRCPHCGAEFVRSVMAYHGSQLYVPSHKPLTAQNRSK